MLECSIRFPVVRMQPSLVWDSSAALIARATVLMNTAKGEELKDIRKQSWNLTITNPTSAEVQGSDGEKHHPYALGKRVEDLAPSLLACEVS